MAAGTSVHRGAQFIRQWRLLRALEGAKRGMSAAQLKDTIEETQSTRTLYRDLEVLEQAGFPLTNEGGRWRLLETSESSWAIPANPTEVVALMLTEDLLAPVEDSWLAEPLANLPGVARPGMLYSSGAAFLLRLRDWGAPAVPIDGQIARQP
jgi:hypothetical protein